MIKVPRISRADIDAWPVAGAGLPIRCVRSLRRTRLQTIGLLRRAPDGDLRRIRGIGATSIRAIHDFFATCDRLEAGTLQFRSPRDILGRFVTPAQFTILDRRYALTAGGPEQGESLDAVGQRLGLTRERVRQLESAARAALGHSLPRACLAPVASLYDNLIRRHHGVAGPEDLASLAAHPLLAGFRPAGLLALLADAHSRFAIRDDTVLLLTPAALDESTSLILEHLRRQERPLPAEQVLPQLPRAVRELPLATRHRIALFILDHTAGICATDDGEYFIFERAAAAVLDDILRRAGRPLHFRTITREFNTIARPGCRKGTRHVLDILRSSPLFTRATSGYYALARERAGAGKPGH